MKKKPSGALLNGIFLGKKDLYYRLMLSIGLLFVFPAFGFLFFAVKYNIVHDSALSIFLAAFLAFSFAGFILLRNVFKKITKISEEFSEKTVSELTGVRIQEQADELSSIIETFGAMEGQLRKNLAQLDHRALEIATLKELSDLCYVTFDTDELFYVTLERALKLVRADVGSVLILDRPRRKKFSVKAQIGLGDTVKVGDMIDFDTSIAKYAVINKSALLVEDIEKDGRFGRNNRSSYATKSFICMPLKTIGDIIGVINISRRNDDMVFTQHDVEVLTPLLSNAAFTYENIRLFRENEFGGEIVKVMLNIFKLINSSLRDNELMHSVLSEVRSILVFDLAVVLAMDGNRPDELKVVDVYSRRTASLSRGSYFKYKGTVLDKAIQQESTIFLTDTEHLADDAERGLFGEEHYGAALVSVLRINGEVSGAIVLCAPTLADIDKGAELTEVVKDSISLAVERARLFSSVLKKGQELDALKQIGEALAASTFNIDEVLKYAMDMIRVTMDVEAGSLFLVNGDMLECRATIEVDSALFGQLKIKMGQGIAGYAASQGKTFIANDAQGSPYFFPSVDLATGFKTKSVLCVPMISKGKVIGLIELLNKRNGDFDAGDEQLLQSIISSLVISIENARLYQETVSMTEHERGIRQIFQKFVPREVVDKIIHGEESGTQMVNEFRMLTFLNIDIRGFSKLAMSIGPHRTVPMINYFFSVMGDIVFRNQGIVDKYLGDGFLAIFGAPVPSIGDADNAVAAALEMKASMEAMSEHFVNEIGVPVSIGIAIHTGEAVIGNIGFDKKMDYTVIGDAVNTVFRLQSIVKPLPNGILISEKTRKAVQSKLEVRDVGEYEIDAAAEKIKVYEVLGQQRL